MRYTIRNVPSDVDALLRATARRQGESLNQVVIDALTRGADIIGCQTRRRDLSDIDGTWREDPEFDRALAAQDALDDCIRR